MKSQTEIERFGLTLEEKLAAFDPAKHGGELMRCTSTPLFHVAQQHGEIGQSVSTFSNAPRNQKKIS